MTLVMSQWTFSTLSDKIPVNGLVSQRTISVKQLPPATSTSYPEVSSMPIHSIQQAGRESRNWKHQKFNQKKPQKRSTTSRSSLNRWNPWSASNSNQRTSKPVYSPWPIPNMVVQWYKDGFPLHNGNRFKLTSDFGYVALDIAHTIPEDSGVYGVKAINKKGEASVEAKLSVRPNADIL
ncbi:hypothetical protein V3C99_014492, partial [Haemonchus contortus]